MLDDRSLVMIGQNFYQVSGNDTGRTRKRWIDYLRENEAGQEYVMNVEGLEPMENRGGVQIPRYDKE